MRDLPPVDRNASAPPAQPASRRWWQRALRLLGAAVLALFVVGGLFSGALFVATVFTLAQGQPRPALANPVAHLLEPGGLLNAPGGLFSATAGLIGGGAASAASEQPASRSGPSLPAWSVTERVTILLLGIDRRVDERGPSRTDTMLLVTVDPFTGTAGILSMPRDLLVHVPGYNEYRINTAYFLGERERPPRGPQLAKETVMANFGVTVHHYALVDFRGFERIVDAVGGVVIDVPHPIKDDEYPDETGDGASRIFFDEGVQRMDGRRALQYARTRHADSDFGRNQRQQQVLLALRQEALRLNILPRLPALFAALKDAFSTDIPPDEALALAALAWRIDSKDIQRRAIDGSLVYPSGDGGLVPRRAEIAKIIRELFFDGRLRAEAARVEVLNGTARRGLANVLAERLTGQGVDVVRVDNADRADYAQTLIVDGTGKGYTAAVVARSLGLPATQIVRRALDTAADVRVIVGADARS